MAFMPKTFGLAISISEQEANAITATIQELISVEQKLAKVAAGLLRDLAKGGVMLAPEWADRIQTAIGTTEPQAIAEHVEKAVGKRGEATVVEWVVDPTQIQFYQSLAHASGISLGMQLKGVMDWAFLQGWFNMAAPQPFAMYFTQEQFRELQEMFTKDEVTGQDVINRLNIAFGRTVAAEDDFVLDSLKG